MSTNTHNSTDGGHPPSNNRPPTSALGSQASDLGPPISDLRSLTSEFIPYGKQLIEQDDIDAVVEVLKSDYLTTGPKVAEFEHALCERTGATYCVAVANGTAALHLAVAALDIERGKEGITSPITFMASSNSMLYCGLQPRFCDIDPDTYCMSPQALAEAITDQTGLVTPVHFAGQPADMPCIAEIAERRGLRVIEDAAHAIGSCYADGSPVGNCKYSDLTIFSFHPVKTITTGEGGAITTNDENLYDRLLMLRSHGITKDATRFVPPPTSVRCSPTSELRSPPSTRGPWYHEMQMLGFNYRITDLQCALGLSQLKKLDRFITRRQEIVDTYNTAFSSMPLLKTPQQRSRDEGGNLKPEEGKAEPQPSAVTPHPSRVAWHLYVVQIDFDALGKSRSQVMQELKDCGVGTQVHYIPVYHQPYYKEHCRSPVAQCPEAEAYYARCLSLPLYAHMSNDDVKRIIAVLQKTLDV